jgi:hypothetical protein
MVGPVGAADSGAAIVAAVLSASCDSEPKLIVFADSAAPSIVEARSKDNSGIPAGRSSSVDIPRDEISLSRRLLRRWVSIIEYWGVARGLVTTGVSTEDGKENSGERNASGSNPGRLKPGSVAFRSTTVVETGAEFGQLPFIALIPNASSAAPTGTHIQVGRFAVGFRSLKPQARIASRSRSVLN